MKLKLFFVWSYIFLVAAWIGLSISGTDPVWCAVFAILTALGAWDNYVDYKELKQEQLFQNERDEDSL